MSPSRRDVLKGTAYAVGAAGLAATGAGVLGAAPAHADGDTTSPFRHGVASGDPLPDAIILWTRVTPSADATPGSGRGPATPVTWELAADKDFTAIVASGNVVTAADADHTVKVEPTGLTPSTHYFYRFRALGKTSVVGHTKTAPALDADVSRVRFGVVSCANWEAGYFSAYRHLGDKPNLDAIVHLGDYFYEYETNGYAPSGGPVRVHAPKNETVTLRDYRIRHGQYKTDPDLSRLHALYPFIVTWDDHESANDSWDGGAENHQPATEGDWKARKAASEQAYYEWQPVRAAADATGSHLYRRLRFGKLLDLSMLDLRSYRSEQVGATNNAIDDPSRTITGRAQFAFLRDGLLSSTATWKIVGNPVMITPVLVPPLDPKLTKPLTDLLGIPKGGIPINADAWAGYTSDRDTLVADLHKHDVQNTVFITGDIHTAWACDLPVNPANVNAGSVATELVVPSITSDNIDEAIGAPPHTVTAVVPVAISTLNPYVKYMNPDDHGYGVLTVTPTATQMDWFFVTDRTKATSGETHGASYRVGRRTQHAQRVSNPIRT